MSCIGITPFITEAISFGDTHKPKGDNMLLLKEKYHLQHPLYMGDIEADGRETHRQDYRSYMPVTDSDTPMIMN